MTQEDFAKIFHVTRQTVSNWENQKSYPDLQTLVQISDEFDVSIDTLLKEDMVMVKKIDNFKVYKKGIYRFDSRCFNCWDFGVCIYRYL